MSPEDWPLQVVAALADAASIAWMPDFPPAATLVRHRLGTGAGEDLQTATIRATGELVEIASCCAWGDEAIVTAPEAGLPHPAFGPERLSGFSADQIAKRRFWNGRIKGVDWIPPQIDPSRPIDWLAARCLFTGRVIHVPADSVLIGRRAPGDPEACAVADTNGCAAGETQDDAWLRALFELIERDATGRWWYGQRHAPTVDPATVQIDAAIPAHLGRRGRRLVLLDLTSDLGVPTIAALAMDDTGAKVGAGFGTRANLRAAARAAVTELMMMEVRVAAAIADPGSDAALEMWFRTVRFAGDVPFDHRPGREPRVHSGTDVDLASCAARLAAAGCRVAMLNFTRAAFGVPVARAVSPDLCHWKPRFGRARLLASESGNVFDSVGPKRRRNPQLLRI